MGIGGAGAKATRSVKAFTYPEVVECPTQSLNRFHIQMICRFIQNVEIRAGRQKPGRQAAVSGMGNTEVPDTKRRELVSTRQEGRTTG